MLHCAGPESEEAVAGFWAAAADALLMFPLTRAAREALLALACANSGSHHDNANGGGGSGHGSRCGRLCPAIRHVRAMPALQHGGVQQKSRTPGRCGSCWCAALQFCSSMRQH